MDNREVRNTISRRTGIPKRFILGNTPAEMLTLSRKIIDAREKYEAGRKKDNQELFSEWLSQNTGMTKPDDTADARRALDDISEELFPSPLWGRVVTPGQDTQNRIIDPGKYEGFYNWLEEQSPFTQKKENEWGNFD